MDATREENAAQRMEPGRSWDEFLSVIIKVIPLMNLIAIGMIIFEEQFLLSRLVWVVTLCFMFLGTCFVLVLSKTTVVRKKAFARNLLEEDLFDTDLEIDNEMDRYPRHTSNNWDCNFLYNMLIRNPYELCRFRPAYGMFLVTLLLFLLVLVFLGSLEFGTRSDCYYSALKELSFPAVLVLLCICFLANSSFYVEETEPDFYTPFEHFVQIPMKVVVGKTVASFFSTGMMYYAFALMCMLLAFLFMVATHFYDLFEKFAGPMFLIQIPNKRSFFASVFGIPAACCIILLVSVVVSSWVEVRRKIMGTIEKNWERNMVAIGFLLRDVELVSLEQIKQALFQKRNQQLTRDELAAFEYLDNPLWMTKRPFKCGWFDAELAADLATPEVPRDDQQQSAAQIRREVQVAGTPGRQHATGRSSPIITRQTARTQALQGDSTVASMSSPAQPLPAGQVRRTPGRRVPNLREMSELTFN